MTELNFEVADAMDDINKIDETNARLDDLADEAEQKGACVSASRTLGHDGSELVVVYEADGEYANVDIVMPQIRSWAHENGLAVKGHSIDDKGQHIATFLPVENTPLASWDA